MVLVIAQHNLPEPCTDLGHAIVHPALKLNLDGFEFREKTVAGRGGGSGVEPFGEAQGENSQLVLTWIK